MIACIHDYSIISYISAKEILLIIIRHSLTSYLLITSFTGNGEVIQKLTVLKSPSFSFATSHLCSNVYNLNFVLYLT